MAFQNIYCRIRNKSKKNRLWDWEKRCSPKRSLFKSNCCANSIYIPRFLLLNFNIFIGQEGKGKEERRTTRKSEIYYISLSETVCQIKVNLQRSNGNQSWRKPVIIQPPSNFSSTPQKAGKHSAAPEENLMTTSIFWNIFWRMKKSTTVKKYRPQN